MNYLYTFINWNNGDVVSGVVAAKHCLTVIHEVIAALKAKVAVNDLMWYELVEVKRI